MGVFKSIGSWFGNITRKRRISVENSGEERWHADLSPVTFTAIVIAIVTLVFGVLLLLVAYTPLLDVMPGYRTHAGRSREMLMRNIVRLDSLERKMNDLLMYNESRILVVSGKTPITQSAKSDSLHRNKGFVAPSTADSMLRHKIENDSQYRLNKAKNNSLIENTLNAVAPMYGIISDRFNSNSLRGVRINGTKDAQVQAVADGVVVASEWSPSAAHSIVVQHKDNYLSIYRNLSVSFAERGSRVQSGQTIGYAGGNDDKSMLEFELWREGRAVNPELYILF